MQVVIEGDVTSEQVRKSLEQLDGEVQVVDEYGHLTDEQRDQIRSTALDVIYEDLQEGHYETLGIAEEMIDSKTIGDLLDKVSPDPERRRSILGFDPETGKSIES